MHSILPPARLVARYDSKHDDDEDADFRFDEEDSYVKPAYRGVGLGGGAWLAVGM